MDRPLLRASPEAQHDAAPVALLRASGIYKSYTAPDGDAIDVLRGVDLELTAGSIVAIIGPSGSGKSTLLHILGLMAGPDSGEVTLDGETINDMPEARRDDLRRRKIGFLFQFNSLIDELTVEENLCFVERIKSGTKSTSVQARERLHARARSLDITGCLNLYPRQLSSGQATRANIVKCLCGDPRIILMDEPTGNLDAKNAKQVIMEVKRIVEAGSQRSSVLLVTHNLEIAAQADRVYALDQGILLEKRPMKGG